MLIATYGKFTFYNIGKEKNMIYTEVLFRNKPTFACLGWRSPDEPLGLSYMIGDQGKQVKIFKVSETTYKKLSDYSSDFRFRFAMFLCFLAWTGRVDDVPGADIDDATIEHYINLAEPFSSHNPIIRDEVPDTTDGIELGINNHHEYLVGSLLNGTKSKGPTN